MNEDNFTDIKLQFHVSVEIPGEKTINCSIPINRNWISDFDCLVINCLMSVRNDLISKKQITSDDWPL